jgi:phosphatidate cytidylyltransferase
VRGKEFEAMNETMLSAKLFWVALIAFGCLAIGTVLRLVTLHGRTDPQAKHRRDSLKTWWVVTLLVLATALAGRDAAIVVFALISLLAFFEFNRLVNSRAATGGIGDVSGYDETFQRSAVAVCAALILTHYTCLWLDWTQLTMVLLPVGGLVCVSIALVIAGKTRGFVSQLGHLYLGLILSTYLLSHVVLLFETPAADQSRLDSGIWFVYLLALTEIDDIVQALVGRSIGQRRLAPIVSPNKTWEGFVGGLVVTVLLSIVMGHFLTSMTWPQSLAAGVVIAVAGLFGDLNMSAVKRDVGVKDSGHCVPGHGGLLDRVDSLTFTAPIFYFIFVRSAST